MRRLLKLGLLALAMGGPLAGCVVHERVVATPAAPCAGSHYMQGHYDRYGRWHAAHWRCPGAAGRRRFNVLINGAQVLAGFDIFAAAGAAFRANIQTFRTTAGGQGQVVITFSNGSADIPLTSGIEIN